MKWDQMSPNPFPLAIQLPESLLGDFTEGHKMTFLATDQFSQIYAFVSKIEQTHYLHWPANYRADWIQNNKNPHCPPTSSNPQEASLIQHHKKVRRDKWRLGNLGNTSLQDVGSVFLKYPEEPPRDSPLS